MTDPNQPYTVIVTQRTTAADLHEMRGHLPFTLFVADNDVKPDPRSGAPSWLSRMVSSTSVHFDSSLGDRKQITVQFTDGTPDRFFDEHDQVDVLFIMPGKDLTDFHPKIA